MTTFSRDVAQPAPPSNSTIRRIETFKVPPRWLFVRVETSDGLVGWGEASLESHSEAVEGAYNPWRNPAWRGEAALSRWGSIGVIVNVAGMMIYKPLDTLTVGDWTQVLNVNFLGAALFTREAFRHMKPGGSIVNVVSIHARQTSALVAPYAAAKAALESLTRSSAIEGAQKASGRTLFCQAPSTRRCCDPALISSPGSRS